MAINYKVGSIDRDLKRTVANFNAKVRRLQRAGNALVPDTISVAELRGEFTNRADLQRALKQYKSFSVRGAEEVVTTDSGVKLTKYELDILKQETQKAKAFYTREINQLKQIEGNIPFKKSEHLHNLEAKRAELNKNFLKLNARELETFKKTARQASFAQSRKEQFYKNFSEMVLGDAYSSGIDEDTLKSIERKFKKLTPNQLLKLYNTHKEIRAVVEGYHSLSRLDVTMDPASITKRGKRVLKTIEQTFQDLDTNLDSYIDYIKHNK